jgi:hypothetical protein
MIIMFRRLETVQNSPDLIISERLHKSSEADVFESGILLTD